MIERVWECGNGGIFSAWGCGECIDGGKMALVGKRSCWSFNVPLYRYLGLSETHRDVGEHPCKHCSFLSAAELNRYPNQQLKSKTLI